MTKVVLGGGLVGTEIAKLFRNREDDFIVITRTSREILPGIVSVAADATNSTELARIAPNASAIFNSLNAPDYTKWDRQFPPLNRGALNYAFDTGASIVSVSNLYMYDSTNGPIGVSTPIKVSGKKGLVRQQMWEETQAFMAQGLSVAEVRASDYLSHSEQSPLGDRFAAPLVRGKTPSVIGHVNKKHSWTSPKDVARTCVAVVDHGAFGRVWHAATNEPKTFQEVADDIRDALGEKHISIKMMPSVVVRLVGAVVPIVRELRETSYQFEQEFIIDDQETRENLGIQPTAWKNLIEDLISSYR